MRSKVRPDKANLGEVWRDGCESETWAHGESLLDAQLSSTLAVEFGLCLSCLRNSSHTSQPHVISFH